MSELFVAVYWNLHTCWRQTGSWWNVSTLTQDISTHMFTLGFECRIVALRVIFSQCGIHTFSKVKVEMLHALPMLRSVCCVIQEVFPRCAYQSLYPWRGVTSLMLSEGSCSAVPHDWFGKWFLWILPQGFNSHINPVGFKMCGCDRREFWSEPNIGRYIGRPTWELGGA